MRWDGTGRNRTGPPLLARLRSTQDMLPFLDRQISAREAVFRPLPDDLADLIAASPDFVPPGPGGEPVWLQLAAEGDRAAEFVVVRPATDGELWVIAPAWEPGRGLCGGPAEDSNPA